MDSHLVGPTPDGGKFHTYYWNQVHIEGTTILAMLDWDDIDGEGPETTTIMKKSKGVYRFLVHDYTNRKSTNSMALANSRAQVIVFEGEKGVATFNVPVNQGGTVWAVFELDGSKITPLNKMYYESMPENIGKTALPLGDVKLTVSGEKKTGESLKIDISCTNADHLYLLIENQETGFKKEHVFKGNNATLDFKLIAGGTYTFKAAARNTPSEMDLDTERKESKSISVFVTQVPESLPSGWVYVEDAAKAIGGQSKYDSFNNIFISLNGQTCTFTVNGTTIRLINGKIATSKANFDQFVNKYLQKEIPVTTGDLANKNDMNNDIVRQAQEYLIKIAQKKPGWSDCWTDPATGPTGNFRTITYNSLIAFQQHCQNEWQKIVKTNSTPYRYQYLNLTVSGSLDQATFTALEQICIELDSANTKETTKIRVFQLEALNDIAIDGVSDIVWQKQIDANGELVMTPTVDAAVADSIASGSFDIRATINTYPAAPFQAKAPRIKYFYEFRDEEGNRYTGGSGDVEIDETTCRFSIKTPNKVNTYQLILSLKIYYDIDHPLITQVFNKTLYVTLNTPRLDNGIKPKPIWLERATLWAKGATSEKEAVSLLNKNIYNKSGWLYGGDSNVEWQQLVEKRAFNGSCYQIADVWCNLAKILGIQGVEIIKNTGAYEKGFITKPCIALDGQPGNTAIAHSSIDRWFFVCHYYGKWSNRFYDPTFGQEYSSKDDFISEHVTNVQPKVYILESGAYLTDNKDNNAIWGYYEYFPINNSN